MPQEMNSWIPSTSIDTKPITSVEFKRLVNEVQEDQWNGAKDFERATSTRAELFSRLRFPKSSNGVKIKND